MRRRIGLLRRLGPGIVVVQSVLPSVGSALSYSDLEGVQEGLGAQLAFLEMVDPVTLRERREELRAQLLKYCGRDTFGMIVLRRFLAGE